MRVPIIRASASIAVSSTIQVCDLETGFGTKTAKRRWILFDRMIQPSFQRSSGTGQRQRSARMTSRVRTANPVYHPSSHTTTDDDDDDEEGSDVDSGSD